MTIPFTTGVLVTTAELNTVARAPWRKTTSKTVVNTTVETDLLNGEITIDAGAMSTNRWLHGKVIGDYLNNTGIAQTLRVRVKLGATTLWGSLVFGTIAASATRRAFRVEFDIANLGAANSNFLEGRVYIGDGTAGSVAGIGGGNGVFQEFATASTSAIDTSLARLLEVTVEHGNSNASLECRLLSAVFTLL